MTSTLSHVTVYLTNEQRFAIEQAAKGEGKTITAYCRSVICKAIGIEDSKMKHGGRPSRIERQPIEVDSVRKGTPEAEYRVQDLKKRGCSKHYVAALTKLPYAEIERLWNP